MTNKFQKISDPNILLEVAPNGSPVAIRNNRGEVASLVGSFASISEIDSTQGVKRVGSQLFVVGDDNSKYRVVTSPEDLFPYSDVNPTHFFDPTATVSSGIGTYANPFTNNDQLAAWITSLNGNLAGKILGFKRGTVYSGYLNLFQSTDSIADTGGITGSATAPFVIAPYGDAITKPRITLCKESRGWELDSTNPQLYKKYFAVESEIYFIGSYLNSATCHRYPKQSSIENLLSAGAGYACYSGGYVYIYPLEAGNPNLGQHEETFNDPAYHAMPLYCKYKNQSDTGYINIYGLQIDGSAKDLINISAPTTKAAITTINSLVVSDCDVSRSGTDKSNPGACSAINFSGVSDSIRINSGVVSGNRQWDILNNAFECTFADNIIHEWNYATKIGGKNIIELYGSNSNCISRYNYGESFAESTTYRPIANASNYGECGIWQSGYIGHTSTVDATKNVNNVFAFNHARGCVTYAAKIGAGSAILIGNILEGGIKNTSPILDIGTASAGGDATVTLQNNVLRQDSAGATNVNPIYSRGSADLLLGNNNIIDWETSGSTFFYFRNVYASNLTNFKTAINAATPGAQSNLKLSRVPDTGRQLLPGSICANAGKSLVSGVDGATVTGFTDGAFGYRTDLNGELLTGNHIGAYQPPRRVR